MSSWNSCIISEVWYSGYKNVTGQISRVSTKCTGWIKPGVLGSNKVRSFNGPPN